MNVESTDAVVGLAIVIESILTDLIGSQLEISRLVHISRLLGPIEQITIDKPILDHNLKDPPRTTPRASKIQLLNRPKLAYNGQLRRMDKSIIDQILIP